MNNSKMIEIFKESMNINTESEQYDLYKTFDLDKHIVKFPYYTEVIIDREGNIFYATPSHQLYLLAMLGVEKGILDSKYTSPDEVLSRQIGMMDKVQDLVPVNGSIIDYCLKELDALAVHYDFYLGKPNRKQKQVLRKLALSGACRFEEGIVK